MKIVLDPGHGGRDPGAVAGGVREADLALAYARTLSRELARRGHVVALTRNTDVDLAPGVTPWQPKGKSVDLNRRCATANAFNADAFVSLHANAAGTAKANGAWVLHAQGSKRGKALAIATFRELAKLQGVVDADAEAEVFPDQSPQVAGRRLAVLNGTNMPAILVELGFLTNPQDVTQLSDLATAERVCAAIANGLESWKVVA